ncbi:hypothetical protein [Alteribacillus sp. HJP-4]|uniref:hypothetical protein n=1 Tax=Alteribacillus sp. HJP-4 TaxID=2775394 RepID=UPI0035CCEE13
MELVRCKKNVIKKLEFDFIESDPPKILFREGYFYPVFKDAYGVWMTTDEEGIPHVISESEDNPEQDPWFGVHFIKA